MHITKLYETLDTLIPKVLIDVIFSYCSVKYNFISKYNLPDDYYCIYIIDDNVYVIYDIKSIGMRLYVKLDDLTEKYKYIFENCYKRRKIDYTTHVPHHICDTNEYVLSFKYNITIRNQQNTIHYDYESDGNNIFINGISVNTIIQTISNLENRHVYYFAICHNELYLGFAAYKSLQIYKINLESYECQYITNLPFGKLLASYTHIYTAQYKLNDNDAVLNSYNLNNRKYNTKIYDIGNIIHITDEYVFGYKINEETPRCSELNIVSTTITHKLKSYCKPHFGINTFFVYDTSRSIIKVYKISF
jgi:hypothetical protein